MMLRVLVSGFEKFGGESLNPTELLVHELNSCSSHALSGNTELDIRGVVLPVEFGVAFDRLMTEVSAFRPNVILSLGLAAGRSDFELEHLAHNHFVKSENQSGSESGKILKFGPSFYPTTLPVHSIRSTCTERSLRLRDSWSAGTYVCNDLFYRMQHRFRYTPIQSGFIHVPCLPEMAVRDGVTRPSLGFETQYKTLVAMLESLVQRRP
ncbi:MAG TPA: pyroglutamyl-peptidase I [Pseudobdellovibrionaceae bacterium]|nr:pyroglutamyl-peptidase I [Pseudobdellovibrionaceae bacterium]